MLMNQINKQLTIIGQLIFFTRISETTTVYEPIILITLLIVLILIGWLLYKAHIKFLNTLAAIVKFLAICLVIVIALIVLFSLVS